MANLHRQIRASLPAGSLKLLVDEGAHEVILLLFAVLIGRPAQAAEIFGRVMGRDDDDSLTRSASCCRRATRFIHGRTG